MPFGQRPRPPISGTTVGSNPPPSTLKPPAILKPPGSGWSSNVLSGGLYGSQMGNYYDPYYMAQRRLREKHFGGEDKRVSPSIAEPYGEYLHAMSQGELPGLSEPGFRVIDPRHPSGPGTASTSWVNNDPGIPGRGNPRALPDMATLRSLSDAGMRFAGRRFAAMRPMRSGYGADLSTNYDDDLLRRALARVKGAAI